jgi:TRAP transporter TAXI family solute receptor
MMIRVNRFSAIAVVVAGLAASAASAQQLTFMTGPQGGAWIPLGGALKGMWEKAIPGLQIQTTPGAGISNVRGIDEGKAHIGMANSSTTYDGIEGNKPYPRKVTKVCQLANLYPQYFQVVALADAKINSYKDLAGKSLVTQPRGNTAEVLTATVLELNGLDYKKLARASFQASYTDAVSMLKDGHAHVFTLGTTAPASSVMDLASARDVRLVPVDDATMGKLSKANPGYTRQIIKAGTYPKQSADVPVIAYLTHVVVACDLPEAAVYTMVKTMASNIDTLTATVKAITGLTPKAMAEPIGVPLHKGAEKFYREIGAL